MIKTVIILLLLFLLFALYFYPSQTKLALDTTGKSVLDVSKRVGNSIIEKVITAPEKIKDKFSDSD